MTARRWVIPSPLLMDFSFPREERELVETEAAIVMLEEALESGRVALLLTPLMGEMLSDVEYAGNRGKVAHIYGLVYSWISGKGGPVVWFNQPPAPRSDHPRPPCCTQGNVAVWADEVNGISRALERAGATDGSVSALCLRATAGNVPCAVWSTSETKLRLCGLDDAVTGPEAYKYVVDDPASTVAPSLERLRANYRLIGGVRIRKSKRGGSHTEMVEFPGGRPWPIDVNYDPITGQSMVSLVQCSGFPADYIRSALNTGVRPEAISWLELSGEAAVTF